MLTLFVVVLCAVLQIGRHRRVREWDHDSGKCGTPGGGRWPDAMAEGQVGSKPGLCWFHWVSVGTWQAGPVESNDMWYDRCHYNTQRSTLLDPYLVDTPASLTPMKDAKSRGNDGVKGGLKLGKTIAAGHQS